MLKSFLVFIYGGIIMTAIYLSSNVYNNGTLSALISLVPISILACFVINKKNTLNNHVLNLVPILFITLIAVYTIIFMLRYTEINQSVAVVIALVVWAILQYLRIIYYPIN